MITDKTESHTSSSRIVREAFYFAIGAIIGTLLLLISLWWMTRDVILPHVTIAGVPVGGLTTHGADNKITGVASRYELKSTFNGSTWNVPKNVYTIDFASAAQEAHDVGTAWNLHTFTQLVTGKIDIPLPISLNQDQFASWSAQITDAVAIVAQPAKLTYDGKKLNLTNGEDGVAVSTPELQQKILTHVSTLRADAIEIPTTVQPAALTDIQHATILNKAQQLVGKELIVSIDDEKVKLDTQALISFLSLDPQHVGTIDGKTIRDYTDGLGERFNSQPQDAKFAFQDGRVQEFAPGKDGITVDEDKTADTIASATNQLLSDGSSQNVTAVLTRTPPKISTSEVNNLGITERIGRGESYYAHSIANRIFNIGLASSRVNGALVPPGEEFSFNKFVGEISGATGYKTAYVISGGRTVLGDGGGVCQVSTTLFRAAMNAGLPITERWGHAYRVGYYEQNSDPGIDATVYAPSKDFKFRNDTPHYILVQAINDPKTLHLVFEIYGTKDGRVATVSKPKVWGITPPPPDLYQDDPTLPAGQIKQVDFSAWGARTSFDYHVERDGQTIFEKTFTTNYQPWQNVFMRGTGGVLTP